MTEAEYKQHRDDAQKQSNSDLQKTLPHLLADIHDEAAHNDRNVDANLVHVLKRFAAILAIASASGDRTATALTRWTKGIACLTGAIVFLTIVLIVFAWRTDTTLHEMVTAYKASTVSSKNHKLKISRLPSVVHSTIIRPHIILRDKQPNTSHSPLILPNVALPPMESERQPSSQPTLPQWHEVTTFDGGDLSSSGSSPEKDTNSFVVGDRWRIIWSTRSGKYGDQGSLALFIQNAPSSHGTASEGGIALAHNGNGSGDELKYGAGEYYFKILANEPYHIRILSQ